MRKLALLSCLCAVLSCCDDGMVIEEPRSQEGVQVTAVVPSSVETIADIINRGDPPEQEDRVAPDHHIGRGE